MCRSQFNRTGHSFVALFWLFTFKTHWIQVLFKNERIDLLNSSIAVCIVNDTLFWYSRMYATHFELILSNCLVSTCHVHGAINIDDIENHFGWEFYQIFPCKWTVWIEFIHFFCQISIRRHSNCCFVWIKIGRKLKFSSKNETEVKK